VPHQVASTTTLLSRKMAPNELDFDGTTKSKIALIKKKSIFRSNRTLFKSQVSLELQRKMKCLVANDEPMQLSTLRVLLQQADF